MPAPGDTGIAVAARGPPVSTSPVTSPTTPKRTPIATRSGSRRPPGTGRPADNAPTIVPTRLGSDADAPSPWPALARTAPPAPHRVAPPCTEAGEALSVATVPGNVA
ncbi:hypothetical protein DEI86_00615 [Curtobacterium sp. MCBD17_028]|nr:hypothetical protein DEI86_00615 [Curtobacterium sp. MCBD17_028]